MNIELNKSAHQHRILINQTVQNFLKQKGINPQSRLSILFVGKVKMRNLNKKYRQIDSSTDVLSFPIWKDITCIPKQGLVNLGDIVVCPEIVKTNAQKLKNNYHQELSHIIKHSLNHLIGRHH